VQAASPSWLSRISIPYCVHHLLWVWLAEVHDLWGYCVTGGDSFHTIMFICTCSKHICFYCPQINPGRLYPPEKKKTLGLLAACCDNSALAGYSFCSIRCSSSILAWANGRDMRIVGDSVSYEWWDWFQEIDFTWVH
jgi:hypothetical protein